MIGGANRTDFYTVNLTTGALGTTPVFTSNKKVKTTVTATGLIIDQKQFDSAFSTFADTYAPKVAANSSETGTYEDGATYSTASDSSPALVAITFGNTDDTKRYARIQCVKLSQEVHNIDMEANKLTSPQIKGDVVRTSAVITVLATMFPTSHFTGAAATVIPVGSGDIAAWITKNA